MRSNNQQIEFPILKEKEVSLFMKREDLLHPIISGNKYRKLKYNLVEADRQGHDTLITFGGAFSNHIAATAVAGREFDFKTIGIIRGEEVAENFMENPTLAMAREYGMRFKFISRTDYRKKEEADFQQALEQEFGRFYLLPEGGTNALAIKGCAEILATSDVVFDVICCSVGTGGTVAGIINSTCTDQRVLGFSALKGDFLKEDIRKFAYKENWDLVADYHFGGYARVTPELVNFLNNFRKKVNIPLDPIYTGKMVFGILDMIRNDRFKPETKILAIHTGGLQGIDGINQVLKKKNEPLIAL
ncbi:MAG: 1-aminocyclopropane-1-carboxylate deaminase/D-cysteine desulfhydrase [Aurantibacter sp.]